MKNFNKLLCAVVSTTILCSSLSPVLAAEFPDCPENKSVMNAAIDLVSERELMNGDDTGMFRPNDRITRAEAAAVLGRIFEPRAVPTDDSGFDDVDSACFASGYVKLLKEHEIISGTGSNLFSPNADVTYAEFVLMIERIAGDNSDDNNDYLKGVTAEDLNESLTRGDAAIILSNAVDKILPQSSLAPTALTEPVSGVNAFAMNLNQKISAEEENKNYMFSPLSIKTALAMAANGADGETQKEILGALGIDDLNKYNESIKALIERYSGESFDYNAYNALDQKINSGECTDEDYSRYEEYRRQLNSAEKPQLSIANSVWINKDYKKEFGYKPSFKPEFEKTIKDYFGGTSETVGDGDAVKRINDWTSDKTNGKIPSIIDDSDFLAALINAVYFKGKWLDEFSEYLTKPAVFHNSDGTETQTDFMNNTEYYEYYSNADVQMLKMPYKGGNTAMYIALDNGKINNYDTYFSKVKKEYVKVSIPKFELKYENDMNDVLKSLGINRAFSMGNAEFFSMCDGIPQGENVYIDKVLHKTYISVDEEGTEAAAVTAVMMDGGSAFVQPPEPKVFTADRPFTFMIRDEKSGEILFMGRHNAAATVTP